MLKVEIPEIKDKIKQQIRALEYQITVDTRDIDREIHTEALNDLRRALENRK